ncbi:MAG: DUF523 domain-containing protein [Polyangiaceae bacterium]|nr:DUF523 domain-containing protein [Polyangiaceae bacterium]
MNPHPPNATFPIIVSACLLGVRCRYDGISKPSDELLTLARRYWLVPVCPEQLGGLPTPRPRHEIFHGRVVSEHGDDSTDIFERGAREVVMLAELLDARMAILKARSPSCGRGLVHDGTFSGRLTNGDGVLAAMLLRDGCEVYSEEDLESVAGVLEQHRLAFEDDSKCAVDPSPNRFL